MAVGLLNNCESICRRVGGALDFRLKFVASLSQVLGAREDRGNAAPYVEPFRQEKPAPDAPRIMGQTRFACVACHQD
jgi:hypothetical protein